MAMVKYVDVKVQAKVAPKIIKTCPYSAKLSMKYQMFIKTIMLNIKTFLAFKLIVLVFIMIIYVKMPTNVGILTFMSIIIFHIITFMSMIIFNIITFMSMIIFMLS